MPGAAPSVFDMPRTVSNLSFAAWLERLPILRPLGNRDYALLFGGMAVSMVGDGMYFVAIAWQVYDLSNAPTALSVVGVAWTLPMVLLVLLGGVVSDRVERRKVMIAADLVRALAIAGLGALSVSGAVELWHVVGLVALYGAGEAFFGPAFAAIVPDVVPPAQLVQANSLNQLMRPLGLMLVGPALGGLAIAGLGAGGAFLLDAGSFLVSALALSLMRPVPLLRDGAARASVRAEIAEGFRFVRSQTWLWGTLVAAAIALFAFWGPTEVLLPYLVRNELGGGADDYGLVLAAGGVGAIAAALVMAKRGLPRLHITSMYLLWAGGTLAVAAYGLVAARWQAMLVAFAVGLLETAALVVWMTLLHRLVPRELLGRVESLDWLIAVGLVPVSFAVVGPVAEAIGTRATLVGAGVVAGIATFSFLFLPGMRDTERADGPGASINKNLSLHS